VLALEWIHHNIVYFGGDSQRITLFGESAGAVAVGFHLLSPRSRSLFSNAILESGGPTCNWAFITVQEARRRSRKYLAEFYSLVTKRLRDEHYRDERERIPDICQQGGQVDDIEIMFECARTYPILDEDHYAYITNAEYTIQDGGPMFFLLMPVVDGTFLPENPITMLKTGNFKVTLVVCLVESLFTDDFVCSLEMSTFVGCQS
jgi:acetylcholinesterase